MDAVDPVRELLGVAGQRISEDVRLRRGVGGREQAGLRVLQLLGDMLRDRRGVGIAARGHELAHALAPREHAQLGTVIERVTEIVGAGHP